MNRFLALATATVLSVASFQAAAQAPASAPATPAMGVPAADMEALMAGRSVKHDLMGKTVVNDQKAKIGKIDDIIMSSNNEAIYAVVGVGGFVGMGKHDVAIPIKQLQMQGDSMLLPGSTKDALKALPKYDYRARAKQ